MIYCKWSGSNSYFCSPTDQYTRTTTTTMVGKHADAHFLQFPLFRFNSFWQCVGSRTKFALCLSWLYPTLASYRKHSSN